MEDSLLSGNGCALEVYLVTLSTQEHLNLTCVGYYIERQNSLLFSVIPVLLIQQEYLLMSNKVFPIRAGKTWAAAIGIRNAP